MEMTQQHMEQAASLLGKIDSGAKSIFLETVNTQNQIAMKVFGDSEMLGVFQSAIAYERFWISISFETDTDQFHDELLELVKISLNKSGFSSCMIWLRHENLKIINFLKEYFHIQPDCGPHYYASIEFIMRRDMFTKTVCAPALDIRPYEEKYIDNYLDLLDASMSFASPPPKFKENKQHHAMRFAEYAQKKSFEAFWSDGDLVGLYWRKGAEIDIMAVADKQQRKGYGSMILTRAIEMIFEHTTDHYAYLYAVDWNAKGQSFYKKYGMEQNGHSYLLRLNNYTV